MRETGTPGGQGRLKLALFLSLVVNITVIGVLVGGAIRGAHPPPPPPMAFGPYGEALTKDQRQAIFRDFVRRSPSMRDMRRKMDGEFEQLIGLLRAQPYDSEAVSALVSAQQKRVEQSFEVGHDVLLDYLAKMSPADREAFADKLQAWADRKPDGKHKGPPGGAPEEMPPTGNGG